MLNLECKIGKNIQIVILKAAVKIGKHFKGLVTSSMKGEVTASTQRKSRHGCRHDQADLAGFTVNIFRQKSCSTSITVFHILLHIRIHVFI